MLYGAQAHLVRVRARHLLGIAIVSVVRRAGALVESEGAVLEHARAVRHDRQAVQRRLTVEEHRVAVTHVPLHHVTHLVRGRGRVGARVGARVSGEWPGSVTRVHVHADVPLHHVAYRVYAYAYAYMYMHTCMHIYAPP